MSGTINPDWEDRGEIMAGNREEEEGGTTPNTVQAGEETISLETKESKLDEASGGATDSKGMERAPSYNDSDSNSGKRIPKMEETNDEVKGDQVMKEANSLDKTSSETVKPSVKMLEEDSLVQVVRKGSLQHKENEPTKFSTEREMDAHNSGRTKIPVSQRVNRNTTQTCGLMSLLDYDQMGCQITPVEITRADKDNPDEILTKPALPSIIQIQSSSTKYVGEEENASPGALSKCVTGVHKDMKLCDKIESANKSLKEFPPANADDKKDCIGTNDTYVPTDTTADGKTPNTEAVCNIALAKLFEQRSLPEPCVQAANMKQSELLKSENVSFNMEKVMAAKEATSTKQETEKVQDSSEDELLLDGEFSTGSSSSNSLGDIEGVIARMSPRTKELVGRPLKVTQSLQSSNPTQQPSQRGVSKSETTSRPKTGKRPTKDTSDGLKRREMGNLHSKPGESLTTSCTPGLDTPSGHPKDTESLASNPGIENQDKGEGTQGVQQRLLNASPDTFAISSSPQSSDKSPPDISDSVEALSEGEFSTGSSSNNSMGDIEDILARMSPRAGEHVGRPLKGTQILQSPNTSQNPTHGGMSKSDTSSSVGTSEYRAHNKSTTGEALNEIQQNEEKEIEQSETKERLEPGALKPTVPMAEENTHAAQELHGSCLKRNPRFSRKRGRATTPVKPRKRLVNFASFENIRLFSSAKHMLVNSSFVGKSRVRVKQGAVTPEERALREEEIRDQAQMDSDERIDKQINRRIKELKDSLSHTFNVEEEIRGEAELDSDENILKESLSDSNLEEEIYQEYCLDEENSKSSEFRNCQDNYEEVDGNKISQYPDFSSIPSGDIEALARATDDLLEMIPKSRGRTNGCDRTSDQSSDDSDVSLDETQANGARVKRIPSPRKQPIACGKFDDRSSDDSDVSLDETQTNGDRVKRIPSPRKRPIACGKFDDRSSDDSDTQSSDDTKASPEVTQVALAPLVVRAGKLGRVIRLFGGALRRVMVNTRRLGRLCCVKQVSD